VFDNVVLSWRNIAVPLKTLNERYRLWLLKNSDFRKSA